MDLPAEQVEELRRCGRLADLDVVLGTQGEESLEARRGVFGTLTLVAVREQHDQGGSLGPLVLGGHDELVDDDLRTVGEVAELCFPDHERVLVHHGVAVLEPEGGVLREEGVVDPQLGVVRLRQ